MRRDTYDYIILLIAVVGLGIAAYDTAVSERSKAPTGVCYGQTIGLRRVH